MPANNNTKKNKNNNENEDNILNNKELQDLIKSKIYYLEYTNEEKQYYKFSFLKTHWNTMIISYKCSH